MTTLRNNTKRRRSTPPSTKCCSVLQRIHKQFCVLSEIMIVIVLCSATNYNRRSSILPLVNSFTLLDYNYFHYHSQLPKRRRQWYHVPQQPELPSDICRSTGNTDIPQRRNNPSHLFQNILTAISATTTTSSTSTDSSVEMYHPNIATTTTTTTKMIQSDVIWDSYTELMNDIIQREFKSSGRGLRPEESWMVKKYLLQNHVITQLKSIDLPSESRHTIRDRLNEQKRLFMRVTNFTNPMYALYSRCLVYVNDISARKQIRSPALPCWYKIRECGLYPRENAISTCLYVLSMQQRDLPMSTPTTNSTRHASKDDSDEMLFKHACFDVAIFHDLLYQLNEKTALVRIKSYIADHNVLAAEKVLSSLQIKTPDTNGQNYEDSMSCKRLRTYQPIFQYYCHTGNLMDAFRIYREMQHTPGVHLISETYAMLISAAAKYGWFRNEDDNDTMSTSIKSVRNKAMKQLKFRSYCGPDLLDELCSEMSRDVLELDESCAAMIMDGFNVGFNYSKATVSIPGWISDIAQWVQRFWHSPSNVTRHNRRIFLERVSIDNTTAICQSTGTKLRLLTLSEKQIRNVHDSLIQMAESEQEKFGEKGNNNNNNNSRRKKTAVTYGSNNTTSVKLSKRIANPETRNATYASKELSLFSDWLRYRVGDPFTAIIDGPNVAYYGHGDVQWRQVEQVLNKLERMGEKPLVIMPQKYISPKFYIASLGRVQELSQADLAFINTLIKTKKMYVVPSNCLDDYYWMLSSVAEQKSGSNYVQQHVSTDDTTGRFPGLRPLLITNDQMRDHRLALLEPRLFRRWASCHIVKYHIEPCEMPVKDEARVTLFPADFFSREIQCNKASRFGYSTVWHIPIAEWPEPDRLCISVMRS